MIQKAGPLWAVLAALPLAAHAGLLDVPAKATGAFVYPSDGVSPRPTQPPYHVHQGLRRQASSVPTVLVAPDNTCGYISGLQGALYTCPSTDICVFYTAEAQMTGSVGCCDSNECFVRRSCVDSLAYYSSSACTGGCQFDAFTLKCTEGPDVYCNTIQFPNSIVDYWCNSEENTTPEPAQTSYDGEVGRSFSPFALTPTPLTSATTDGGAGASSVPTSSPTANGGSSASSSSTSPAATSGGSKSSKSNTGAIAGGVVGGVAGLAIIGGALWFFFRHKNKKDQQLQSGGQQPMQQQPYGAPPAGYNPQHNSYYGPPGAAEPYGQPMYGQHQQPGYQPVPSQGTTPDQHLSTSPSNSQMTDPRMSPGMMQGGYGAPGQAGAYQPQQGTIHEAPTHADETYRGETHELST